MTAPIPADRLAELRRIATGEDWSPPQPGDVAALIGEIDRLQHRLTNPCDGDTCENGGAAHCHRCAESDANASRARAERAEAERDRLWMLLEIERGLTSTARLHALSLKAAIAFQLQDGETAARLNTGGLVDGLLRALGPQRPRDDAQRGPQRVAGASVMDFPSEASRGPQEPAEGFGPTPGGRLYVNGPPCRHDRTWLVQTETGWVCMVCGPAPAAEGLTVSIRRRTRAERTAYLIAQRDDAIARGLPRELIDDMIADAQAEITPEDEGIATSDVLAQIAADQRAYCPDCALPETNCACG